MAQALKRAPTHIALIYKRVFTQKFKLIKITCLEMSLFCKKLVIDCINVGITAKVCFCFFRVDFSLRNSAVFIDGCANFIDRLCPS